MSKKTQPEKQKISSDDGTFKKLVKLLSKLKKGKDECPFNEDVTLEKVPHVKPTPAHENYNVGDIIEVMFMPEQEVLILEKITCGDDLCQFIGYSST